MEEVKRTELEKKIDILEDDIADISPEILRLLLKDKTTKKNILWCTKDYEAYGYEFNERAEMKVELITGVYFNVIQPRAAKSKEVQERRIRKRAEVFTPSWICNEQNNQVDEAWFGKPDVFNTPDGTYLYLHRIFPWNLLSLNDMFTFGTYLSATNLTTSLIASDIQGEKVISISDIPSNVISTSKNL